MLRAGEGMYGRATQLYNNMCADGPFIDIYPLSIIVVCLLVKRVVRPRHADVAQAEKTEDVHPLSERAFHTVSEKCRH